MGGNVADLCSRISYKCKGILLISRFNGLSGHYNDIR